jgi:hypothetical protein
MEVGQNHSRLRIVRLIPTRTSALLIDGEPFIGAVGMLLSLL